RLWIIMGVVVLLLFVLTFGNPGSFQSNDRIPMNELARDLQRGLVQEITVRGGQDVVIQYRDRTQSVYYKERETDLFNSLRTFGVTDDQIKAVTFSEQPGDNTSGILFQLLIAIVPT